MMTRSTLATAAALAVLSGCGESAESSDAQLLVPDDVSLHWDIRFNAEADGLGALVPVELMVYEGLSGEPIEGVLVKIHCEHDGMVVVPLEDVVLVGDEYCDDCAFLWDAWRDQYFEYVFVEGADIPGASIEVETDENGLARIYLYADSFPEIDEGDFAAVSVLISTAISDETFYLVPQ